MTISANRPVNLCAVLFLSLILVACGGGYRPPISTGGGSASGAYKVGNPYKVAGRWYTPREDPYYDQVGTASWYGRKFHGRSTANGETYDMNDFSAAHTTLPMPSYVKVTNLSNNRSIVVRINDRGPFVSNRIIDLSRRAAQELGYLNKGTARVRVEAVRDPIGERFILAKATTTSFERNMVAAAPTVDIQIQTLSAPPGLSAVAPPVKNPVLVENRARGLAHEIPSADAISPRQPVQLYVQAGAFSDLENARKMERQLAGLGATDVAPVSLGGTRYFRVRIGPLDTLDAASETLTLVINGGHPDARIVVGEDTGTCRTC